MKKKHIFLALALTATVTLGGFTACGGGLQAKTALGFNCYDDVKFVSMSNILGRIRTCSDDGFYTEGGASLKLDIQKPTSYNWHRYGEKKDFLPPTLKFPIEEQNISGISTFLLDVYNANGYDTNVYLYAKSADEIIWSACATAQSEKWNKLAFSVNADFSNGVINEVYVAIADVNENTTYYFDNLKIVNGSVGTPEVAHNGNVIAAFQTADEVKAAGFYTKTDIPAASLSYATAPDGKTAALAVKTESYSGRINSVSYLRDDREYGFTIAKNVLESFSFANARKCYIEVYNACEKARRITLTVSDGENIATRETEIPVGVWTKVSVNNLLSLDLTKINEVTVALNAYDHFEAGALYFKNLSVEVGK